MSVTEEVIAGDIEVNLDAPVDPKAKKMADPEIKVETPAADAKKPIVQPDEGIEKIKKQLAEEKFRADAEREGRLAAEARAREAAEGEAKAKTETQVTQLDMVTGAIATLTSANDTLEANYASSMQAGDFAAAAKAQREMATNAARQVELEAAKKRLESAPKPTARAPSDPVEQLASQLSARSAEWVRAHPEFARDPKKYQRMLAAHNLAISDDIKADSDEYFRAIEETLRISQPGPAAEINIDIDPMADAARPVANGSGRSVTPAAAPVSRSGNGAGSRPNVVRATAQDVEAAAICGQTIEEYMRHKMALKKEGQIH